MLVDARIVKADNDGMLLQSCMFTFAFNATSTTTTTTTTTTCTGSQVFQEPCPPTYEGIVLPACYNPSDPCVMNQVAVAPGDLQPNAYVVALTLVIVFGVATVVSTGLAILSCSRTLKLTAAAAAAAATTHELVGLTVVAPARPPSGSSPMSCMSPGMKLARSDSAEMLQD